MKLIHLDRHVLASSPSTIDRGMQSYAWTKAIAGPRADAIFRRAPWGEPPTDSGDVPSWTGTPMSAAAIPTRLESAFLALDDRLALSVWGAFGDYPRRTLTHTILFDEATFVALSGNPFVLYDDANSPWLAGLTGGTGFVEPAEIEPITLSLTPDLARRAHEARLREIFRLRAVLLENHSSADLESLLAAIYDRLGAKKPIELIAGDDEDRAIVRLAWLSLPVQERLTRFFCTEQTKAGGAIADLVAKADGLRSGSGSRLIAELVAAGQSAAPGRKHWASVVTMADETRWTQAEADLRSFSSTVGVVNGDTITPFVTFRHLKQQASAPGPAGPRADHLFDWLSNNPDHGLEAGRLGELIAAMFRADDSPRPNTARQVWMALKRSGIANTSGAVMTAVDLLDREDETSRLHALLFACAQASEERSAAFEHIVLGTTKTLQASPSAVPSFMRALGAQATAGNYVLATRAFDDMPKDIIERIDLTDLIRSGLVDLATEGGARWTASLVSMIQGVGVDRRAEVQEWILSVGIRAHPAVRQLLARSDFLERALQEDGELLRGDYFAIASPDIPRLFAAVRKCYRERGREPMNRAIAYLAKDARVAEVLAAAVHGDDAERTLALLLDPAWSTGGPDTAAAINSARGLAVSDALMRLVQASPVSTVPLVDFAAALAVLSPTQARKLGEALVRTFDRRDASAAERTLFWSVLPLGLADSDTAASALIERALTSFPPANHAGDWLTMIVGIDATLIARKDVFDRLSAALLDVPGDDVRIALLRRVSPIIASHPTRAQTEGAMRLCWPNPELALRVVEEAVGSEGMVQFEARLLVSRPPLRLLLALLPPLSALSALRRREILAVAPLHELREIAPTLTEGIDAGPMRRTVAFLPKRFIERVQQVELSERVAGA